MKKLLISLIIIIFCLLLGSCDGKTSAIITSINISQSQKQNISVSEGKIITGFCFDAVCDKKLNNDDITFVSTDSQVAEVSHDTSQCIDGNKIYCKIKAKKPGQVFIYAKAKVGNAVSEKISVAVVSAVSKITVSEKNIGLSLEQPYIGTFAAYAAGGDATSIDKIDFVGYDSDIIDISTDGNGRFKIVPIEVGSTSFRIETSDGLISSDDIKVTVAEASTDVGNSVTESNSNADGTSAISGDMVYVTNSGKKYHFSQSCGGINSTAVGLEEAEQRGYEPCKRCAQ